MKCIQIEFRGNEEYAPVYRHVTGLTYAPHWFSFKFKEDGSKEVWTQKHPISVIYAVREWNE